MPRRKPLANYAGANISANTFLAERINETLSGHTAPVAVNVYGNDLKLIDDTAQKVAAVLRSIPGAASVQLQSRRGFPQLTIRLRRSALERWGFDPVQVFDVVRTAYQGDVVGQTYFNARQMIEAQYGRGSILFGVHKVDLMRW